MQPVPPGADTLVVHRIGYDTLRLPVGAQAEGGSVRAALSPDPVVLAGLDAIGQPGQTSGRVIDGCFFSWDRVFWARLLAGNTLQVVEDRLGLRRVPCRTPAPAGAPQPYCAVVRGSVERIRLYVDDQPRPRGLDDLAVLPLHEVHWIEEHDARRMVRVYTHHYIEALARAGRTPDPPPPW